MVLIPLLSGTDYKELLNLILHKFKAMGQREPTLFICGDFNFPVHDMESTLRKHDIQIFPTSEGRMESKPARPARIDCILFRPGHSYVQVSRCSEFNPQQPLMQASFVSTATSEEPDVKIGVCSTCKVETGKLKKLSC